jgi:hypothetical protein
MAAVAWDIECVDDLPAVAPLVPFAPMLGSVDRTTDGQRAMQSGRSSRAAEHAAAMLRDMDARASGPFTPAERAGMRAPFAFTLGIYAAVAGKASALDYAKELDQPNHRSNAWRLRMVYELMHGRSEAAAICQRRAELFALQDSAAPMLPGTTVRIELLAAVYADDVIAVKRSMERIEALCGLFPGWRPALSIARAHYRRLQGDLSGGLVAAREAVALAPAGRHLNWGLAVSTELELLNALGRAEEAVALGHSYLATATELELDSARTPLLRVMAECCVRAGHLQDATRMADEHLRRQLEFGTQGLQLGLAYETCARVAIRRGDEAGLHRYAQLCAAQYKGSRNALLGRKYQQLMHEADAAGVAVPPAQRGAADISSVHSATDPIHRLRSELLTAVAGERAQRALQLLLEMHGAVAGYLFATRHEKVELLAASIADEPSPELMGTLTGYLASLSQASTSKPEVANERPVKEQPTPEAPGTDCTVFESVQQDAMHTSGFDPHSEFRGEGFEAVPLFVESGTERVLVALAALRFEGDSRSALPQRILAAFADALDD